MTKPQVIAIAALAENRVIGHAGGIPWRLREEMRWFRQVTLGHPVVMGHRTFRSLSKPLPGRLNVVLTRNNPPNLEKFTEITPECLIWLSPAQPEEILAQPFAHTAEKIFIIGGAQIYQAFLPLCDHLILSHVRGQWEGDTFFPPFENNFQSIETLKETPDFTARLWIRQSKPPSSSELWHFPFPFHNS